MTPAAEIVETLKHSPKLPLLLDELNKYWLDEKKRRQKFYKSLHEDSNVEFINGKIFEHLPVTDMHISTVDSLVVLTGTFVDVHSLGKICSTRAMIQLTRNDYEPDICFFGNKKIKSIHPDTLLYPVPDFVVEVLSPSTIKLDREIKFKDYELHEIEEYWIIDPAKKELEQYLLVKGKYLLNLKTKTGLVTSKVIKGFEFPVQSIFDNKKQLETLKELMQNK